MAETFKIAQIVYGAIKRKTALEKVDHVNK
jgi:hypothetical protein